MTGRHTPTAPRHHIVHGVELTWHDSSFDELTLTQLYSILELRQRIFIVEQRCPYLDADGADQVARHLWAERDGAIVAYLRILPAGVRFVEVAIGRAAIAHELRRTGLGRELMRRGIAHAGRVPIRISAQAHLESFYEDLGFSRASEVYDEDGIPHLQMLRTP